MHTIERDRGKGRAARLEALGFIVLSALLIGAAGLSALLGALGAPVGPPPELIPDEAAAPPASSWAPLRKYESAMERVRLGVLSFSRVHIPFYDRLLEADAGANLALNRALYDAVFGGDGYAFLPVASIGEGDIYVHKDEGHLFLREADGPRDPFGGTALINAARARNPRLNLYVYVAPPLWLSPAAGAEDAMFAAPDVPMEAAVAALDPAIERGMLALPDYGAFARYYFYTDHHWNMDGAYRAYREIAGLIARRHPDVEPHPLRPERAQRVGAVRGSLATMSAYAARVDEVSDGGFELPAHRLHIAAPSGRALRFSSVAETRKLPEPMPKYMDVYGAFFTPTRLTARFVFPENRTGRRLLLLGDSLRKCIMEPLASHFDEAYAVDVRYDESFQFDAFVREHGITDALLLFGDTYNDLSTLYGDKF